MDYLDVLIVCGPERYIPQLVFDHLLIQKVPIRFFISNVKGDGAASARNFLKEMWNPVTNKSKYVLMTDNDLYFPEGTLLKMIDFLDKNQDFAAISLHRHEIPKFVQESKHINAGPVLYRSEIFEKIRYHNNDGCECQGMTNDIKKMGHRIGYLNGSKYEHIEDTRRNDV